VVTNAARPATCRTPAASSVRFMPKKSSSGEATRIEAAKPKKAIDEIQPSSALVIGRPSTAISRMMSAPM
jgi:hypothetical protein